MPKGTCKICGCTNKQACNHTDFGPCWWIDESHELCSHCVELKDVPGVVRPFPEKFQTSIKTINDINALVNSK